MKPLTEFVGSFLFMFTIALAAVGGSPIAPIAIGGALMVMVYMGGHHSGAHYNPAVSLAILMRGKMESKELAPYWIAQIAGGILAFALGGFVVGKTNDLAPAATAGVLQALIVEILFTMMLALVVLNVATHPKVDGNSFYGLAIGFTIVVAAIAGGGISGGCYNPAVGIGMTLAHTLMGGGSVSNIWIYIIGPLAGGALAATLFKMQCGDEGK
jgi:aquaporin Z